MELISNLFYQAPPLSSRAMHLHEQTPVADLHIDTLSAHSLFGYDATRRHRPWVPFSPFINQVDLPRAHDAGMGILGLGLICFPKDTPKRRLKQIDMQLDYLEKLERKHPGEIFRIQDAASLKKGLAEKKIGALPGVEGAHALSGDWAAFDHLVDRGIRYFGLAHFSSNEACFCAKGLNSSATEGLTAFGRQLVERIEKASLILDLAHINKPGFMEACGMLSTPPIVSHTGVNGTNRHWRNIDDDQIEAVAKLDGVVGIMFSPKYCGASNFATLEAIADSVEHVRKIAGYQHVCIGSDMDGWLLTMPRGLADIADLPRLTEILIRRGWTDKELTAFLGGNVQRVLQMVLPKRKGKSVA